MKKFLLSIITIVITALSTQSQSIIISENFDTYDGLVASIPVGFTITWNDTASISKSFYSSSGFCGVACNSYKFGHDSAKIISPVFANAGSMTFYMKGNGTVQPNTFYVMETSNGVNWDTIATYNPIPTSSQTINLPLNSSSNQVQFYYKKDSLGFNVGFDDLIIYGPAGVNEVKAINGISIYPSPSTGIVNINFNQGFFSKVDISIINILGKEMKHLELKDVSAKQMLNISDQPDGMYLVKIKSGTDEIVKRIILKR